MYEWVTPFLIAGLTIIIVVIYYDRLLRRFLSLLTQLINLQADTSLALREYAASMRWQLRSLGIEEMGYEVYHPFGTVVQPIDNPTSKRVLVKEFKDAKLYGKVSIVPEKERGEWRVINQVILYIVTLQLIQAAYRDIQHIESKFQEIAKLQTYMIHDLKNVLQFFETIQYNLEQLQTTSRKVAYIDILRISIQPIAQRIHRLLGWLHLDSIAACEEKKVETDLVGIIEESARLYGLDPVILGEGSLTIWPEIFKTILENIFLNIAQKGDVSHCWVTISTDKEGAMLRIEDDGAPFSTPERVKEPFYSTKQGGLGIGMFQSSTLIEKMGGSMECLNEKGRAVTILHLHRVSKNFTS